MSLTWEPTTTRALDPFCNSDPGESAAGNEQSDASAMLIRDLGGHNLLLVDAEAYPGDTGNWHSWPYYADETHQVAAIPLTLTVLSASRTTAAKGRQPIGIGLPRNNGFRTTAQLSQPDQLPILCDTRFVQRKLMQRMHAILTDPDLDRGQIGERLQALAK